MEQPSRKDNANNSMIQQPEHNDNENIIVIQGRIALHEWKDNDNRVMIIVIVAARVGLWQKLICQRSLPNLEIPSRQTQGDDANAPRPTWKYQVVRHKEMNQFTIYDWGWDAKCEISNA